MEMRETVERMVMVRTTGSDLQPAATGYIYKKRSNGPASVVKMDESEILEQLSKFYDQPKVYAAPDKESDENKAASHSNEYVIPVVEKQEEKEHIDGIADEDYGKEYEGYDDYKKKFTDYLHGLGHFEDGIYHKHGSGEDYGSKGHHEYGEKSYKGFGAKHHYGKGDAGDYHTEKYDSFYVTGKGGHKKEYDEENKYGNQHAAGHEKKGGDHGHKEEHSEEEKLEGFHKVYDKNEFKKDHDFYDGEGHEGAYKKYGDGHSYHGSKGTGHEKGATHGSEHHDAESGKEGEHEHDSGDSHDDGHSSEAAGSSEQYGHKDFSSKGGSYDGKGYGFKVKH